MTRIIRYLAATDSSPVGMLALGYLSGLLRIGRVRIGSMTGGLSGRWEHYAQLLATPMTDDYVNVVCCAPERWIWEQRVPMPTRMADGSVKDTGEVASARQELYTAGKHNVIMIGLDQPSGPQLSAALRYEQVIVSTERSSMIWNMERHIRQMPAPRLIPLPIIDPEPLRSVVFPP